VHIPSKATLKRREKRQKKQKLKERSQGLEHVSSNHSIGQSVIAQMNEELKREVRKNRTLSIELDEQKLLVRNLKNENLVLKTKLIEILEKNKKI
jgi:hypothetical protein